MKRAYSATDANARSRLPSPPPARLARRRRSAGDALFRRESASRRIMRSDVRAGDGSSRAVSACGKVGYVAFYRGGKRMGF